jgi:hypothetical protein
MEERRTEGRMLCADMIEVSWTEHSGKCQTATALLEDISPSGACLQLEAPVPLYVPIRWTSPNQEFAGVVRYCHFREIGYFVGVAFSAGTKWSEQAYQPQHLLDLKSLI